MADIQIGGLPLVTTATDSAILHTQIAGVDKSITKVSFLKELKAEVDTNTAALSGSGGLTATIGTVSAKADANEAAMTLLDNWTKRADKAVLYSTNGVLVTGQVVNEFTASATGTLPLANSVTAGTLCIVSLSDTYKTSSPLIVCSGGDTITLNNKTDTSLSMDSGEALTLTFVSDGISKWRL